MPDLLTQLALIFGILMVVASVVATLVCFVVLCVISVALLVVLIWVSIELINDAYVAYIAYRARIQELEDRKQIQREQEARRLATVPDSETAQAPQV